MTGAAFTLWLASMKGAGIAPSDAAAGRLLGVAANTIVLRKRRGASQETALACAALLAGCGPFIAPVLSPADLRWSA